MRGLIVGDKFIAQQNYLDAAAANPGVRDIGWVGCDLDGDKATQHTLQQRMETAGPNSVEPPPEVQANLKGADILVVHFCPVPCALLQSADQLKLVVVARSGLENVDLECAESLGVTVKNIHGRNAGAVAELSIGLMLAESRNVARAHHSVVSGGWRKQFSPVSPELAGSSVGLIGFGAVGQEIARRLRGFEPRPLLVYDPYADDEAIGKVGATRASLAELLATADYVSVQARLTDETAGLIGAPEFAVMKPTAIFVNVGRSRLVDTSAMVDALATGQIAGAGLDVFDEEPLPYGHPLRSLDNVTLTTHFGGDTANTNSRSAELAMEEVERWRRQ